jgi:alkanesulfonate monooxygenase SsuD/methylene tetrahydromethanopterin reductase-like flavin-dependent oxidoreductase (luciferase family)
MKFGLYVPPFGEYASARVLADLAKEAEVAGWDGFFTWDHVAFDWITAPLVDPWVACTAIAMNTTRIRFGPLVTPLARRRPWKLARETVSLDHLSGGRLILGVGLGGGPAENAAFGEPSEPKELAGRLDEGLEILAGLWSGKTYRHEGRYYHVKDSLFLPPPLQNPRIPIWVAGYWPTRTRQEGPFRRAARWDGIYPLSRDDEKLFTPEDIQDIIACVRRYRTTEAPFDVVHTGVTSGADLARAAEHVAPYAASGVTWWLENVNPFCFGWRMQGPWPVEAMRERILQGPPCG